MAQVHHMGWVLAAETIPQAVSTQTGVRAPRLRYELRGRTSQGVTVSVGSLVPAVPLRDVAGNPIGLRELASSGPVVVFVWKADCDACAIAAPVLPRLAATPGLTVAAVAQDDPATAAAVATASGWTRSGVRALLDPEPWVVSGALGVTATPTWILLAPGGQVAWSAVGWSRAEANDLAARAAALARAHPVVVSREGDGPAFRPG